MNKRFSLLLSVLLAVIISFPAVQMDGSAHGKDDVAQSRYGYTPIFNEVADPSDEAICVDAGDFDGTNNDDLAVGLKDSIMVMANNGATGPSFDMNLQQTISVSGYYITRIAFADYDGDSDQDIIALGQEEYFMYGEPAPESQMGPSVSTMKIFYIENQAGSFSIEDSELFEDAYSFLSLWYYTDSKYDMDVADVDSDGDMDTVVAWVADGDGDPSNGGEDVKYTLVSYDSGSLSNSSIETFTLSGIAEFNTLIRIDDFDNDDSLDLVISIGGVAGGAIYEARLFIKWHTGSGANWGSRVDLDPNDQLVQGGVMGSIPYALEVGDFGGRSDLPDIALTNNRNGGNSPNFGDAGIYLVRTLPSRSFADPQVSYTQIGDFMFRGMAAGQMDKEGRDDLICFTKQDQTGPPDGAWYDAIDGYGLSLVGSRGMVPYGFYAIKVFETPSAILPMKSIKGVSVGNFDNDPDGLDDVVYVGDVIRVSFSTYPPNNPPEKKRATVTPSPVLNDNQRATINLTIEDMDGAHDLTRIEVDFTTIGMAYKTINEPEIDPNNYTIGWYEFKVEVPPTVEQGDHTIKFYMFDKYNDGPSRNDPKANDTFLFRVKQYNRAPEIALDEDNRTLYVKEDTPTYFENIYDWFYDADIEEGYAPDILNISMRSFNSDTYVTTSTLSNAERIIMRADLKNGSAANPQDWSLLITPYSNFHHDELESNTLILRASDGDLITQPNLRLKIVIVPVNDLPVIPVQKRFESDGPFEFSLTQGETTVSYPLEARDEADQETQFLEFFFEYDNPDDEEWLKVTRNGMVSWFPENDHVGDHKVTLWVSDGEANVSKTLWFNVSNKNDRPVVVSLSNKTKTITDIPRHIEDRYEFIVKEHEEFNLTIVAEDIDHDIGLQDTVTFRCNLTMLNNTYLDIDPINPFKANLHFVAEKKFGYFATHEPDNPPLETEIIISDGLDQDIIVVVPLRIIIQNVNDPPVLVTIDEPAEGEEFEILYNIQFSAGRVLDPDTDYNDTLVYQWDFDASDGEFQADYVGLNGHWDFPSAGDYMITFRATDSAGNYLEAYRNITVNGFRDDDDFDNDGLDNKWEDEFGLDKYDPSDAMEDTDNDGLTNLQEFENMTDPTKRDTDNDGSLDSEDFSPLNPGVWQEPSNEDDDSGNLVLIIIIVGVLILVIALVVGFLLFRSMKRSREEEEKRKKAEQLQQASYEDQDLYSDLPPAEQPAQEGAMEPAPQQPQLPEQSGEDLDDIFGGAGTLPTGESAPQGLPAGSQQQQAPQGLPAAPEQKGGTQGASQQKQGSDVTDLLDQ